MILSILGYCVSASCIITYVLAASGRSLTPNLWANATGGPIVAFGNSLVHYWPAVILEVFFTLAGVAGLLRLWYRRRHVWDFKEQAHFIELMTPYSPSKENGVVILGGRRSNR